MDVSGESPEMKFEVPAGLLGYEWASCQNAGNSGHFVAW
jgi:hypothetical protein